MRVAFVTNNASRHPGTVAEHLSELGIAAEPDEVVTSAQAAARVVAAGVPPGSAVLVLGSEALAETVEAAGLRPVRTIEQAGASGVAAVVQGLSPATSMADLAQACVALRYGAMWVTGNTDTTLPSPAGPLPGNGAFVDVLAAVTGLRPVVAGKPEPALHRESVERIGSSRPLVVGDRLDTDILGAVRGGADSLLVLTGVTDRAGLAAAAPGSRPTYLSTDLRGLLSAHPPVVVDVDLERARCGGAAARYVDGQVREVPGVVAGAEAGGRDAGPAADRTTESAADDGLRCVVGLAWARRDAGLEADVG